MRVDLIESQSCGAVPVVSGPVMSAEEAVIDRHIIQQHDLENRVVRSLYAQGVSKAGAIEVKAKNGTITLRGQVPDRHTKWLCLECCRHVAGVNKLFDQLEVLPPSKNGPQKSAERSGEVSGTFRRKRG